MIRLTIGMLLGGALMLAFFERDDSLESNTARAAEAVVQTIELAMNAAPTREASAGGTGAGEPDAPIATDALAETAPTEPAAEATPGRREPPAVYVYSPTPVPAPPSLPPPVDSGDRAGGSAAAEAGAPERADAGELVRRMLALYHRLGEVE